MSEHNLTSHSGPHFDSEANLIYYVLDGEQVDVHTGVSRRDFELIRDVDRIQNDISHLFRQLYELTDQRGTIVPQKEYSDELESLVDAVAKQFSRCVDLESELDDRDSDVSDLYLPVAYKTEKNLKHILRCVSVAHGIRSSQQTFAQYCETGDYSLLYDFVRNVCSTAEYTGTLVENRIGEGDLEMEDTGKSLPTVYKSLLEEGVESPLNPNSSVTVQPFGESMALQDVPLDADLIEYLWTARNRMVHRAPLVVSDEVADTFPNDVESTIVYSETEADRICYVSHRLHIHTTTMFIRLCLHYEQNSVDAFVEALFDEQ